MSAVNLLMGTLFFVVPLYYHREHLADSQLGRYVLAGYARSLRWRAEAHVIEELRWLGKFFVAAALLCLSLLLLRSRIWGIPTPGLGFAHVGFLFAACSIHAALNPRLFIRKFVREAGTVMAFGPAAMLALDALSGTAAVLPVYAQLWRPLIDLSAYNSIELTAQLTLLHIGMCVLALIFYGLTLSIIPAMLYLALSGSKRLCAGVLGLSEQMTQNLMAVAFLIVTLYGAVQIAAP